MPNAKHFKTTQKTHCLNCQNKSKASIKFNSNHVQHQHKQIEDENDNSNSTSTSSSNVVKSNKKAFLIDEDLSAKQQKKRKMAKSADTPADPRNEETEDPDEDSTMEEKETVEREAEGDGEDYTDDHHEDETIENTHESSTLLNSSLKNKKKKRKRSRLTLVKSKAKVIKTTTNDSNLIITAKYEKEISHCRTLLTELMRNDNAWPFMNKVSPDDYPNYYEVIKEPMDFQTIKSKCAKTTSSNPYETKEQFAYDCRLIFDNCEFFNEDKSEIGRAGHKLRAFFETKWIKLFD
jgi:hypothetical protein